MKTMYRLDAQLENWETGRHYWKEGTDYNTFEAIKAKADIFDKSNDHKIVARTIDENNFSVVDEVVEYFDSWKQFKRYMAAKQNIESYTFDISEAEKAKARCKTEKSKAKKEEEIARYKEKITKWENVLAENPLEAKYAEYWCEYKEFGCKDEVPMTYEEYVAFIGE